MLENQNQNQSPTNQSPTTNQKYDNPFVCYDNTKIIFGKLKGKPHSILKEENWKKYAMWIKNQGDEFRYQPTREYILNNVSL